MKPMIFCLAVLPLVASAADRPADKTAQALAAIRELGDVNGQALACSVAGAAAQAKALMLKHAPRTSAYGDAFQEATNAAFKEQTRQPSERCPDAAALGRRLDALTVRLGEVLPLADEVAK